MKLYDFELSGNCYRVRLLLTLLGLKHEVVPVNLMKGEEPRAVVSQAQPARSGPHAR